MRVGYWYLGVIWSSISDCNEMVLASHEEEVYTYAMRRIAEGHSDWMKRTLHFEQVLKKQAKHIGYKEVMIMD